MAKQRIVIVGGGFGGVFTAKALARRIAADAQLAGSDGVEVELISERNYFVFQPLLPEVASGAINAQDAVTPLRLLLPGVKVRLAEVKNIDWQNRSVQLVQGRKRVLHQLPFDHLVLASGQITDLSLFQGFEQHSLTMKDMSDAFALRNKVIANLELADVTDNLELKQRLLTFVVAGGGFSGVETIGELAEMIRRTLKFYPNISMDEIRMILVQRGKRILPELPEALSAYAQQKLEQRGIEVKLNTGVSSASSTRLITADNEVIETNTIVTTIGNGPSAFVKKLGLTLNRGKIVADAFMQVQGQQQVWTLGDIAQVPLPDHSAESPSFAPPTAQFTAKQAEQLAANIHASIKGKALKAFAYKPRGSLASLGNYSAVANVFGVNLSGLLAWFLWRGFYIAMLPGISTRMRVALNWAFDYVMPRTIVHMAQPQQPACQYLHFAAGEKVFNADEWVDGLYVVASGELQLTVAADGVELQQDFVRVFKPGEHWGERIIVNDCATTGELVALCDTTVMVVARDDYTRLRQSLPVLDDYFNNIDDEKYSAVLKNIEHRHH